MTAPHMPEVDPGRDIRACVEQARRLSAGDADAPGGTAGERCVAVITPGGLVMGVPCPPPEAVTAAMLKGVRAVVPAEPKRAVTVIAFTDVVGQDALGIKEMGSLIPFLGYLMGMAFDGHTVVAFEGHPSALAAGCRDADVLLVDEAMAAHLPTDWARVAGGAMRTARILVFGRDGSINVVGTGDGPPPPDPPEARAPARVGVCIRSGRFAAAEDAAAAILRKVERDRGRNRPVELEFAGEAYEGFFTSYFAMLGARDAGNVDPAAASTIDALLDDLQDLQERRGKGRLSRYLAAYYLRTVTQLLPILVKDDSPEGAAKGGRPAAALADVLEDALATSAGPAPADDQGGPSPPRDRKPWWKFW